MQKVENGYEQIKEQLEEHLNKCKKYLYGLDTERLLNLSFKEVKEIKEFCDEEYLVMTKFLMVDLYHIVGMVQFTTRQVQEFYGLVKEYSSYRPEIKHISQKLKDLNDIPTIPIKAYFKLLGIKGTVGDGVYTNHDVVRETITEDLTTLDDYHNLNAKQETIITQENTSQIGSDYYSFKKISGKSYELVFGSKHLRNIAEIFATTTGSSITVDKSIAKIIKGSGFGFNFIYNNGIDHYCTIIENKNNSRAMLIAQLSVYNK